MTHIWVPKAKIIEPKKALDFATRLRGRFKLDVYRPDGRLRTSTGWFDNLITDAGLNYIGTAIALHQCAVGTGNASPTVGDTALGAQVATTTTEQAASSGAQGAPPYYGYFLKTWRFAQGAAEGNLTEIGVRSSTGGAPLWSRALILDSGGTPTTLTVLSDEFLDATYEIRTIPPAADVADTITIGASNYDVLFRASQVTNSVWSMGGGFNNGARGGVDGNSLRVYAGAIGTVTQQPSGTSIARTSSSEAAYGNNNLYRETTGTWGVDDANFGGSGILSAYWGLGGEVSGGGRMGAMQCSFTPGIPKNEEILSLVFRHTWARGTP